jgi:hypothetical protein
MSSLTSTLTMTEPLQVKGLREHLSTEHPSIPSGVMQAVLMHALQLRRSCERYFSSATSNDTAFQRRRRFSESARAPQSAGSFWLADEWMR